MHFHKYPHLERFGTDEVENIELGECWIFPKLDGTNGSIWSETGRVEFGSRNRQLSLDDDNQGFMNTLWDDVRLRKYFSMYPNHRLYGEWLVPHAFKGYREDVWRRFWIFDVSVADESGIEHFIPYVQYQPSLESYGLDYILPIVKVVNPSPDVLVKFLDKATFLCETGQVGEGIVIKNYGFYNKYNRQTWAKIVRQEFKEVHTKHHGVDELQIPDLVEAKIVDKYITQALVDKEHAKIQPWTSKDIPKLFGTVYHCLINEELWNILKEFKDPKINFKTLRALMIARIKVLKPELF